MKLSKCSVLFIADVFLSFDSQKARQDLMFVQFEFDWLDQPTTGLKRIFLDCRVQLHNESSLNKTPPNHFTLSIA